MSKTGFFFLQGYGHELDGNALRIMRKKNAEEVEEVAEDPINGKIRR